MTIEIIRETDTETEFKCGCYLTLTPDGRGLKMLPCKPDCEVVDLLKRRMAAKGKPIYEKETPKA